eukprot:scaffold168357_cov15-Tisochrysis_lutea.AAC.1
MSPTNDKEALRKQTNVDPADYQLSGKAPVVEFAQDWCQSRIPDQKKRKGKTTQARFSSIRRISRGYHCFVSLFTVFRRVGRFSTYKGWNENAIRAAYLCPEGCPYEKTQCFCGHRQDLPSLEKIVFLCCMHLR